MTIRRKQSTEQVTVQDTEQVEAHVEAHVEAQVGIKWGPSRDQVLKPLLEKGFIEMTVPDKPQSSNQKYRLTKKGKGYLKSQGKR